MIGHSERRHVLGETDEEENKKVLCALNHNFYNTVMRGRNRRTERLGISEEIIRIQLKKGLYGVTTEQTKKLWIAYEPVWAIGVNGKPATRSMQNRFISLSGKH